MLDPLLGGCVFFMRHRATLVRYSYCCAVIDDADMTGGLDHAMLVLQHWCGTDVGA